MKEILSKNLACISRFEPRIPENWLNAQTTTRLLHRGIYVRQIFLRQCYNVWADYQSQSATHGEMETFSGKERVSMFD